MTAPFELLHSEEKYSGRVFTILRDELRHVSGYDAVREVVRHGGGAVAVAVFPNNDILLIRQYRYPVQQLILELPAGKLDPDEDPLDCARRELEEETGWRASRMEHLTSMLTTPGFCSEVLHIYLARDLAQGEQRLEEGEESIEVLRVPLADALRMCATGEIVDGKTVTGLALAAMRLGVVDVKGENGPNGRTD